jgi:hypothetical protein
MSSSLQKLLASRKALGSGAPVSGVPVPGAPVPAASSFTMPTPVAATGWILAALFYTSATIFLIFLLLVFVHFTVRPIFKFTATDPGIIQISGGPTQLSWMTAPAPPDTAADVTKPLSCDYSISMDVLVSSTYSSMVAPRILLYRGATPVPLSSTTTASQLMSLLPTSNLLIYVDNLKNDLHVVAFTAVNGQTTMEAAPMITNIPLQTPFRLSVVYTPQFMEVYLDGKMVSTRVFKGIPVQSTDPFMSPPKVLGSLVKIARFNYWPTPVMAADLRAVGGAAPVSFFS